MHNLCFIPTFQIELIESERPVVGYLLCAIYVMQLWELTCTDLEKVQGKVSGGRRDLALNST